MQHVFIVRVDVDDESESTGAQEIERAIEEGLDEFVNELPDVTRYKVEPQ